MTPRRLLFLLCVSVLFLSVVHLTRAGSNLIVNESRTRFVFQKDHIDILFAVENTTGQTRNASIRLELLDTKDAILSETSETQTVAPGIQILRFKMPQVVANLTDLERRDTKLEQIRHDFRERNDAVLNRHARSDRFHEPISQPIPEQIAAFQVC